MLDLAIVNGDICDGSGLPPQSGDIGIRNGRIVAIGKLEEPARRTIDVKDLVVAPGFIDIHTHYDAQAFWDPTLSPSPLHGVTTVIGGNCGFSIAPLAPETTDYLMGMLGRVEGMPIEALANGVPWDWSSTADFLGRLEGRLTSNSGWMVGHSALRCVVMGDDAVGCSATPAQLQAMQNLLRASLQAGGFGFTSSWGSAHNDHEGNPVPSRRADVDELVALCTVVSSVPGTALAFQPPNGEFTEELFDLLAKMSNAANRSLNWNTLMVDAYDDAYIEHQLSADDYAGKRGGRVVALAAADSRHNRVNFFTGAVFDSLPGWSPAMTLPPAEKLALLRDPIKRAELATMAQSATGGYSKHFANWGRFVIMETFGDKYAKFKGSTVKTMAESLGVSPWDALVEIVINDELKTVLMHEDTSQDDLSWQRRVALWRDPRAMVGASDAGAHLDMTDGFAYSTTVIQKAVRERRLMPLEEAVAHLSSEPAALYGLVDRGTITEGAYADLVVFDPETIGVESISTRYDLPTGAGRLYGGATGIEHVIVSGVETVCGSEITDARPGQVLHSGRDTRTVPAH